MGSSDIDQARQGVAAQPTDPAAYAALGWALIAGDKPQAAIAAWERAIALGSGDVDLHWHLAQHYQQVADWEAVLAICDRAWPLAPDRTDLFLLGVEAAFQLERDQAIIERIASNYEHYRLIPSDGWLRRLSDRWAAAGRARLVVGLAITVLQRDPLQWFFYDTIAYLLQAIDHPRWAADALNRAIPAEVVREFSPESPFCEIVSLADPAVQIESIAPVGYAVELPLQPPIGLDATPPPELQKSIATDWQPYLAAVTQGRAWGDWFTSAVFSPSGRLLEDLSGYSAALIASSQTLPTCEGLSGRVAFLTIAGGTNYFHWMLDLLPRFELLQRSRWGLEGIDRFVVFSRSFCAFQRETLDWLGIPADKTIESADRPHIQADCLLVPSIARRYGNWLPPRWGCQFLRDRLGPMGDRVEPAVGRPRLYISRRDATYRRVANEAELLAVLEPLGFQTVVLSDYPLAEQIALFQRAEVIVAPHGAGLLNLVFCPPETIVVELFSPKSAPGFFWVIANYQALRYGYLVGADPAEWGVSEEQSRSIANHEDIWVRVTDVRPLLDRLGSLTHGAIAL